MSDPARPLEAQSPDHSANYADELAACEKLVAEVEAAERQYRAGFPVAARMHLLDVISQARALMTGELV